MTQLNLPTGSGSYSVVATVIWSGNGVNHPLSSVAQQTNSTYCYTTITVTTIGLTLFLYNLCPPYATSSIQLRCLIVITWAVDVQSALHPDWGQSSRVGGVALATAVRCCKNAPMMFLLLRGEIVLLLSSP